jgi:hypothetical protein
VLPSATPAELQAFLEADAFDLGASGKDTAYGAGKLELPTAPPAPVTGTPSGIGTSSATVAGSVLPRGAPTT